MSALGEQMARLEEQIKGLREDLERFEKLEPRVGSLERWRAFLAGGWVVLAAVIAYLTK